MKTSSSSFITVALLRQHQQRRRASTTSLVHRLVQAARGNYVPSTSSANATTATKKTCPRPLPCFPLYSTHIQSIAQVSHQQQYNIKNDSTASSSSSFETSQTRKRRRRFVTTPSEFHNYLCTKIRTAQQRVKIASLYIGTGGGCMSSLHCGNDRDDCQSHDDGSTNTLNPTTARRYQSKEEEFLHSLRLCATKKKSDITAVKNTNVDIKIVMDERRSLRPVKISSSTNSSISYGDNSSNDTTNSATEVYYSLFPPVKEDNGIDTSNKNIRVSNNIERNKGVYLFPVHDSDTGLLQRLLPSPVDETLGVFHIKAYIVDDELILSGANLSEEYFTNRLDRYLLFVDGANGLVDFYSNFIDILADYGYEYQPLQPQPQPQLTMMSIFNKNEALQKKKQKFAKSLSTLFQGHLSSSLSSPHPTSSLDCSEIHNEPTVTTLDFDKEKNVTMYAIPTLQIPPNFFSKKSSDDDFTVIPDAEIMRNILLTTLDEINANNDRSNGSSDVKVRLSSAYLNPTNSFMSVLEQFQNVSLMTAGLVSHGFAQKPKQLLQEKEQKNKNIDKLASSSFNAGVSGMKDLLPSMYLHFVKELSMKLIPKGGQILLYERMGWTFHAKGLWLTTLSTSLLRKEEENELKRTYITSKSTTSSDTKGTHIDPIRDSILACVVGSSNFGARSEMLDFESNCILIPKPSSSSSSSRNKSFDSHDNTFLFAEEWNEMLTYSKSFDLENNHVNKDVNSDEGITQVQVYNESEIFLLKVLTKVLKKFF